MADRTEITGWSSIEHPSYQEEALYEGGLEVLALGLVTSCPDAGFGLGFYGLSHCGYYFYENSTEDGLREWVLENCLEEMCLRPFTHQML